MDQEKKIDLIFNKGIDKFNSHRFYEAHEFWEEIWTDYRLSDAKFIQAMIQLSVGCFHITNMNLNGAKGLFKKSQNKFLNFEGFVRGVNISEVTNFLENALLCIDRIDDCRDFDWELLPFIKVR